MKAWNSLGLGRVTWSERVEVAHIGTGPVTVTITLQPRRAASVKIGSYFDQSYCVGSVASKLGRFDAFGEGATSCQYRITRSELAPSEAIWSKALSRRAGSPSSRGASKGIVWWWLACAAGARTPMRTQTSGSRVSRTRAMCADRAGR